MIALIDGDIIVYKAGFAVERKYYTLYIDNEEVKLDERTTKTGIKKYIKDMGITRDRVRCNSRSEVEDISHAMQIAKTIIQRAIEETKSTDYKVFITSEDKSNYRYKIAKTKGYKANRTAGKPHYYKEIRDYLKENWEAEECFGEEADDRMGIAQSCDLERGHTIICSIDKDMLMIPGMHYNIDKRTITEVSEFQGYYNFYKQMLMGDNADNIPGIDGVGPKTASQILEGCTIVEELENKTKKAYKYYFPGMTREQLRERFTEVGQLLWIRREDNQMWGML